MLYNDTQYEIQQYGIVQHTKYKFTSAMGAIYDGD